MNNIKNSTPMCNLNSNEATALRCIQEEAMSSTGGDFTYFEDVLKWTELGDIMSAAQFKGYLSQLQNKGLLVVDGTQIFDIYYA